MTPALMVLTRVTLYRYECPLTAPLRLAGDTWRHRRGLLLRLEADGGAVGWGDAAPLPGFSTETLADVEAHARSIAPRWIGTSVPASKELLEEAWRTLPDGTDAPASFRFATESAVVELLAAAENTTPADVLGKPRSTVALNALIAKPEAGGTEQAARLRDKGYRAVKVKVGRRPVEQEVDLLRRIRRAVGTEVGLRADANRAWSLAEAVDFADGVERLGLEYIEEPLGDPSQLSELEAQVDVPVALDETTRETTPTVLRDRLPVSAVVLKPTLLGGLQATQEWIQVAQEHAITPVLSAAYESGVGLRMLLALAAVGPDVPVGLSTYERLATDVLQSPLRLEGPTVEVGPNVAVPITLDETHLDHIDTFSS